MRNEFPQPFGPYELLRRLGRGGMAEVYLAKAPTTHGDSRLVALKRMHAQLTEDQSAVDMLVQEARLAMRFDDPHIAQTFELGCHDGTYFFIMEYVDGVDLGTLASTCENRGSCMPPHLVAHVCSGIARGLSYAHELCDDSGTRLGIVHRDVSPQNVLISRLGEVKIIDFGVAKVAARIQQTMAGIIKGKYAYMSPEQASAEPVDPRSDVFSLGVCMWELVTGKPLFRALGSNSPFAVLRAVREDPIAKAHNIAQGLSTDLSAIIHKALERDKTKRFQSMAALADELDDWMRRTAPGYDARRLADDVRKIVLAAPPGSVPQNAIATPPLAKMALDEYQPSQLSVVAQSPIEASRVAQRRPHPAQTAPETYAAGSARQPSMMYPRAYLLPEQRAELEMAAQSTDPEPVSSAALAWAPPVAPPWWPSRRVVKQFLWVGAVALVFALGWSTIATLVRMGTL
ncbi:MAG: serine/threonine protein kinase [Deltaproteobacteria bacterium]|nr:serine/threonine protein kinase [Deltaproteobacteria bacterium]